MAYRIRDTDKSIEATLRRIAREQIDKALASLESTGVERPAAVHDVRKRCKKLRGLIRLVRPSFARYGDENAALREVARLLGELRDSKVLQDTYDAIMADYAGSLDRHAIAPVRAALTRRRKAELADADLDARFAQARALLCQARERAAQWSLCDTGWDALGPGLAKTYTRAREAMADAADGGDGEQHHEWRKRVKYHWYHARLLRCIWPERMDQRAALSHELAGLLGDHHDCHVFEQAILVDPAGFAKAHAIETLIALTRRRRAMLEEQAHRLGTRLLADKAGILVDRWSEWWDVWAAEGDLAEAALARCEPPGGPGSEASSRRIDPVRELRDNPRPQMQPAL